MLENNLLFCFYLNRLYLGLMLIILPTWVTAVELTPPMCRMLAPTLAEQAHLEDLVPFQEETIVNNCIDNPDIKWIRTKSGQHHYYIALDGPHGSGRFWTIAFGVADKKANKPNRGICIETQTTGWRTIGEFKRTPLPWLADLDGDNRLELIIWTSFALHDQASNAEYGLMAWVYQFNDKGLTDVNWDLTRQIAIEIAQAYRAPLAKRQKQQPLRDNIARALEDFAAKACLAR